MAERLVQEYNPEWPSWFLRIRGVLRQALGNTFLSIQHVGSTAIPGMVARPIIDIDIVIKADRFREVGERLRGLGYVYEGDKGVIGRESFDLRDEALKNVLPPHHLYVCSEGSAALKEHLAFRDFLRKDRNYHQRLCNLKLPLAERSGNSRQAYMDGKAALVQEITERALQESDDSSR
jgi:GrpB-like predicted nucleotidyltransferase (UPF0157 family)